MCERELLAGWQAGSLKTHYGQVDTDSTSNTLLLVHIRAVQYSARATYNIEVTESSTRARNRNMNESCLI